MTKRKAYGAGKKKMPAPVHARKSKSVPLSGPKDPVKRLIPKAVEVPVRRRPAAAKKPTEERGEELPSILDAQMRLFESMVRFTPLGYFMRVQGLVREDATKSKDRSA
jgi:hypothetical protein